MILIILETSWTNYIFFIMFFRISIIKRITKVEGGEVTNRMSLKHMLKGN